MSHPEQMSQPMTAMEVQAAPQPQTKSRSGRLRRTLRHVREWLSSSSDVLTICYTLLALYALPLIVILVTFVASDGFSISSPAISFSMALAGLYASDVRETLGTFVVPFIMAYAVAGAQKDARIESRTLWLFFTLAALFVASIIVYCAITTSVNTMLAQSDEGTEAVISSRQNFLAMSEAYVKELLVYISLLIGISQARRGEATK